MTICKTVVNLIFLGSDKSFPKIMVLRGSLAPSIFQEIFLYSTLIITKANCNKNNILLTNISLSIGAMDYLYTDFINFLVLYKFVIAYCLKDIYS